MEQQTTDNQKDMRWWIKEARRRLIELKQLNSRLDKGLL